MTTYISGYRISTELEERFRALGSTVEEIRSNLPTSMQGKEWDYQACKLHDSIRVGYRGHCPMVELTLHFLGEMDVEPTDLCAGFSTITWYIDGSIYRADVPKIWNTIVTEELL